VIVLAFKIQGNGAVTKEAASTAQEAEAEAEVTKNQEYHSRSGFLHQAPGTGVYRYSIALLCCLFGIGNWN
jgi:hypothetical protein